MPLIGDIKSRPISIAVSLSLWQSIALQTRVENDCTVVFIVILAVSNDAVPNLLPALPPFVMHQERKQEL